MGEFRRYLLVTDHNGRIAQEDREVDIVSWDSIKSIANAADYDGWILNTTALQNRVTPKLFTREEIRVLFDYHVLGHVMDGGGRIFIIGDFTTAFYILPSTGSSGPKGQTPPVKQRFDPFEKALNVERDPRPIDYRRVSRPKDYNYPRIYAYLDKVSTWDYSLKFKENGTPFTHFELGTTNFGTCLAADILIGSGHLFLLPPLRTTVEEEDRYVLQQFLGVVVQASSPAWANKLVIPGQKSMEETLSEKQQSLKALLAECKAQAKELTNLQRWKRLLYDDGVGLEEIVKESLQLLGANVIKVLPEKDDYRLKVEDYPTCVLEVKGTRRDQFLRKHLRQLSDWMDQAINEELAGVKGAFVGNAAREKDPSTRGPMFEANSVEFAKVKGMVIIRAADIYCQVLLALLGKFDREKFWKLFFACSGEFDGGDCWKDLPPEFKLPLPKVAD